MSDNARRIARALQQASNKQAASRPGRTKVGVVASVNPLTIDVGRGVMLPSSALLWTNAALASVDDWSRGDSVALSLVEENVYVVHDVLDTGEVLAIGGGGGGGGVSDHGALTGLSDDDHPQYALTNGLRGNFAALTHTHTISDVTGLGSALAAKADVTHSHAFSTITGSISAGQYGTGSIVNADINASAAIAQSKIANLVSDLAAKAPSVSPTLTGTVTMTGASAVTAPTVAITDNSTKVATTAAVTTALAGYSVTSHTHTFAAITGTVSAGQYGAGSITNNDISASAGIALSKLAVDPSARANHTGSQLASTISNFDTQVRTSRLDQMAAPAADVAMGTYKFTGLGAGSANGHSLRYEQMFTVGTVNFLGSVNVPGALTLLADWSISRTSAHVATVASGDVIKMETPAQTVNDTTLATTEYVRLAVSGVGMASQVGSITLYGGASLPLGYLYADGSAVSRTDYADLFAIIGTAFGVGNGSTTFNLPDLRGRTPVGLDNMDNPVGTGGGDAGRLDVANTLGGVGGTQYHTLTGAESGQKALGTTNTGDAVSGSMGLRMMRANHLTGTYYGANHGAMSSADAGGTYNDFPAHTSAFPGAHHYHQFSIAAANATNAHNNMQPFQLFNWIIKAQWAESTPAWGNAAARLSRRVDQSIPSGVWTTIDMSSVADYDTSGMTTVGDRITVTVGGEVEVTGHGVFLNSAAGAYRGLRIMKNGALLVGTSGERNGSAFSRMNVGLPDLANVGDYYEVQVYQDTGSPLTLVASSEFAYLAVGRRGYQTNPNQNGQLIQRKTSTVTVSTGSLASAGVSGNFFAPAPSVVGDGVNYYEVEVTGYAPYISAGTAGHFNAIIYDETLGTVIAKQQFYVPATGVSAGGLRVKGFLAPFTGSKSLGLRFENSTAGASTIQNQAAPTFPTIFTIKFAGSLNHA